MASSKYPALPKWPPTVAFPSCFAWTQISCNIICAHSECSTANADYFACTHKMQVGQATNCPIHKRKHLVLTSFYMHFNLNAMKCTHNFESPVKTPLKSMTQILNAHFPESLKSEIKFPSNNAQSSWLLIPCFALKSPWLNFAKSMPIQRTLSHQSEAWIRPQTTTAASPNFLREDAVKLAKLQLYQLTVFSSRD